MASKIVVLGAVNGRFREVFKKLAALHSKNAFACAIIAGDLFADPQTATEEDAADVEALIKGAIEVPLSTYFALSNHALPENIIQRLESSSGEICENLFFLGKRTTIKTSEGIRIVALGGNLDSNITAGVSKDKYLPFFTEDDAKALKGAHTTDILVTNVWPSNVRTGSSKIFDADSEPPSHQTIADLCLALKPRYHFTVSPQTFYEREPFRQEKQDPASDDKPITRFISLAQYNNAHKQKWIYAFTLSPPDPSTPVPAGTTSCPLTSSSKKRPLPSQQSYHFSTSDSQPRKRNRRNQPPTRSECFFCLSSPTLATHLITSIGTDAYLTTAKGPLPLSSTYPSLSFPAHILIIPLVHAPTLSLIQPAESRSSTYAEMTRYRRALDGMLAQTAKGELGSVTWEVARQGGVHTHWQWVPLPADLVRRGLATLAFEVEAENDKYPAFVKKDAGDGEGVQGDYFRVVVWGPEGEDGEEGEKGKEVTMYLPLDDSFRFDLQFGRRVVAKLLGLEKRVHWKDCGQTEAEETADVEAFKGAFKEFDFSLEE